VSTAVIKKSFAIVTLMITLGLLTGCGAPEDRSTSYLEKARALYDEGDTVKAKLQVNNALQIEPKNAKARFLLALINEREGKTKAAIAQLLMVVDTDPSYVDARIKLGNYYVLGDQLELAQEQRDEVLELASDSSDVILFNARVLAMEGDFEQALEQGKKVLASDPSNYDAVSFVALQLGIADDLEGAMTTFDEGIAVALEKDQVDVAESLGDSRVQLLGAMSEYELAEIELLKMAETYPDNNKYRLGLISYYVARERMAEAETQVRKLIETDPDDAAFRLQLARLLIDQSKAEEAEQNFKDAVKASPDSNLLKFALGSFYESQERYAEALEIYEQIAVLDPVSEDGLAARNLIASYYVLEDRERAEKMIEGILTDVPDNVYALMYRSAFRGEAGEYDGAISDLRSALVNEPDALKVLYPLARVYAFNGNNPLAEDTYRRILEIDPLQSEATKELAILVGNRGNDAEAEELFRRAVSVSPEDAVASLNLSRAMLVQQDYLGAETEARRLIESGFDNGEMNFELGLSLEAQGKPEEAISAYRRALDKAPGLNSALLQITQLLIDLGRLDEAEQELKAHIAKYPDLVPPKLFLADYYYLDGEPDAASAIYEEVIELDPTIIGAYIGLSKLYEPKSPMQLYQLKRGLDANPGNLEIGFAVGSILEKRAQYQEAIAVYEEILAATDNDLVANNLAALLLDYRADRASHERALELASRFDTSESLPLSKATLGWAYYRNEDYAKAVRFLELAVAVEDEVHQIHYYLGMAYLKNGDTVSARQQLETAIEMAEQSGTRFTGLDDARVQLAELTAAG